MQFVMQFVQGVSQAWRRLSASARVNLVAASVVTVLVIVAVVMLQTRPQYVRLYANLDLDESSQMQGILTDQSIPFTLSDGGATIMVPIDKRDSARVALAQKNLPTKQGEGWELFDKQNLLTNESQQSIQYQRALEGELMRQLNEFDFVTKSDAHVFLPKDQLWTDNTEKAKAAVTLDLRRDLSPAEVKGVLQVISAFGGSKLSTSDITLVTSTGQPLHLPIEDNAIASASTKLEYAAQVESQREAKLRNLLLMAGAARAVVSVAAEIDFKTETVRDSQVQEGVPVVTSTTESTTSNKPNSQGAPGMAANAPQGVVPGGANETNETNTETTENYEVGRRETETKTEPGEIKKWSVSAAIDTGRTQQGTGTDNEPVVEYQPMTDQERTMYKTLLAKAVPGLAVDEIEVFDLPMKLDNITSVDKAQKEAQTEITGFAVQEYAIIALKLILVVLGILAVLRFFRRAMVTTAPVAPVTVEPAVPTASPEEIRKRQIASEVERMSRESPDTVAALLRSWMSEVED